MGFKFEKLEWLTQMIEVTPLFFGLMLVLAFFIGWFIGGLTVIDDFRKEGKEL